MSTITERMMTVGDVRDYMTSVKIHFDELSREMQALVMRLVDIGIARSLLGELDPNYPNNFPLCRGNTWKWQPEFYIAGLLPADADPDDNESYEHGELNISRTIFDSFLNYVLYSNVNSRLWIVAVPLNCYVEHVRKRHGDAIADKLRNLTDVEIEKKRKYTKAVQAEVRKMTMDVYYAIFNGVRRDCFGRE